MASPKKHPLPPHPRAPVLHNDINIEKWNLFTTQKHKGPRTLERKVTLPDGTTEKQIVTVGEITSKGRKMTLTATEAKVFYLLLQMWHDNGENPEGVVHCSLHRLLNNLILAGKDPKKTRRGNWSKTWIDEKIRRLTYVPIAYEYSYKDKNGSYRRYESLSMLQHSDIFERKPEDINRKFFDFSLFKIHPVIIKSILDKNTKPVRPDVLLQLQKEISIILYRFLDIVLFEKSQYERNVIDLAAELGFGASRRNNLLHQLRDACAVLEGKDLSHGRLDSCFIKKTADGRDWKLVAVKGRQRPPLPAAGAAPASSPSDPDAAEETSLLALFDSLSPGEKAKIQSDAETLFTTKYARMGGELTRRYALLDALRARQAAPASV